MTLKNNIPLKTLGRQAALLVTTLHDLGRTFFRLKDVCEITGVSEVSARTFCRDLVNRGVATRLKPGLFILVPFELGHERQYVGNPLLIAREIMKDFSYYISHASAMEIHGMLTQPRLDVTVTSPEFLRSVNIFGIPFRFVRCQKSNLFGLAKYWVNKQETICVSDLERTLIDGLKAPEYCGGLLEVAKGLWIHHSDVKIPLLVSYGQKLGIHSVLQRLGFLLETYKLGAPDDLKCLKKALTNTYIRLDPSLPAGGHYYRRWRLQLNVTPEEIQSVVRT